MKTFALDPKMLTLQGVFYPTGYALVLFPEMSDAEQAGRELEASGFDGQDIMLIPPKVILKEIGKIDGESDVVLPSVGTEGATVRKYVDLAREGHCALMVRAPSDEDTKRLMAVVGRLPFSYGQKYHMLAIEDLE
ncbi:RNA-binding protein [Polaromonas sp.]|uniref:RNA-binding protein n=1 Tax=Polaromonas sp. TaxID=1869339 RepID=UPI0018546E1A|nr:RNA-binding protein [Polaromonas sp.]NML85373.1 RNA-binding protein [Polaromonas sp.]